MGPPLELDSNLGCKHDAAHAQAPGDTPVTRFWITAWSPSCDVALPHTGSLQAALATTKLAPTSDQATTKFYTMCYKQKRQTRTQQTDSNLPTS